MSIRDISGFVVGVAVFYLVTAFTGSDIAWITRLYNGEGIDWVERILTLVSVTVFGGIGFVIVMD